MRRGLWTSHGQKHTGRRGGGRRPKPDPRPPCPECGQNLRRPVLIVSDQPTCTTCWNVLPPETTA